MQSIKVKRELQVKGKFLIINDAGAMLPYIILLKFFEKNPHFQT